MNTWNVVHRFVTLSNRDFITPLACRMCSHDLTIKVGANDEPTTKCYTCGAVANISMATLLHMESIIKQYERR